MPHSPPSHVLPSHAETVIICGGIVGCSVAYHLAKEGQEVILLERKQLTSGSTWHAAGLVSQFHGFPCITRLASYGIELMSNLEKETGQATGFKRVGATAVAMNPGRREELRRRKDVAIGQGIEVHTLTMEELSYQWPLLKTDGILEAIHFPNDGQTNPIDTTIALAKGARMAGASIFENTAALRIMAEDGQVVGVETEQGIIKANNVVNCTGIWGQAFAASNRTRLPIQHNQHFYIVTDPVPGLTDPTPVLRVYDEQAYYKEDAGKLMIGFAELNGMAWNPPKGIPHDFEFDELPYPDGHLDAVLEKCIQRVPALENAGIRTFFNGPEGYTPDGRYYLGEDPNINNLFVAAGFNSSGIQNGPGAGMVLSQWILRGHAPRDLVDVDIRRIQPHQSNTEYLAHRGPETLRETYAMHWPYKQRETMRGLRRSPIHEQLKRAGAVFGESAGWERPMWFAPEGVQAEYEYGYNRTSWFPYWEKEHHAVRRDCGLIDLSPFCKLLVEGSDAERLLQKICTNNIAVPHNRVVYTQWLNDRGGIEADVTVVRLHHDRFLVMTSAATGVADHGWLRKHRSKELDVNITDISTSQATFGISGPRARTFLSAYADVDLSNDAFPFSTSQEINLGAIPVRAQRISYTGESGWEIFVDVSFAPYLFELLMSGEKTPPPTLIGFHAGESLRTEKAYRHWGHDMGYTDTPMECGLLFASKLKTSHQFIGRSTLVDFIEQSKNRKSHSDHRNGQHNGQNTGEPGNRRLLQFLLQDNEYFIYHNEPIFLNGKLAGAITTGTYGHTLGAPVGLGWITVPNDIHLSDIEHQHYEILVCGKKVNAQASLQPMYDPKNERIRG